MTLLAKRDTYDADGVCTGHWALFEAYTYEGIRQFTTCHHKEGDGPIWTESPSTFASTEEEVAWADFRERSAGEPVSDRAVLEYYAERIRELSAEIIVEFREADKAGVDLDALRKEIETP